jgi:hypothetical protein
VPVPSLVLDAFAALMVLVALASAARLVIGWRPRPGACSPDGQGPGAAERGSTVGAGPGRGADVAAVLTAVALGGILVPGLRVLPAGAWAAVFVAATGWFAWRVSQAPAGWSAAALAGGPDTPWLVQAAAMEYLFLGLTGAGAPASVLGSPGETALPVLSLPTLALAFAVLLAGYAVRDLDRLGSPGRDLDRLGSPGRDLDRLGSPGRGLALAAGLGQAVLGITAALLLVLMI